MLSCPEWQLREGYSHAWTFYGDDPNVIPLSCLYFISEFALCVKPPSRQGFVAITYASYREKVGVRGNTSGGRGMTCMYYGVRARKKLVEMKVWTVSKTSLIHPLRRVTPLLRYHYEICTRWLRDVRGVEKWLKWLVFVSKLRKLYQVRYHCPRNITWRTAT